MATKIIKYYLNANLWLPSKQQWLYLVSCVNKKDFEYIYQFKHKNDCKIRLLSQLLIRHSIKELTNLNWNEINIDRFENGKPYLMNKLPDMTYLDFNISHTSDYVAICAIQSPINYQIGVDIMKIDKNDLNKLHNKSQRIIKKAFTNREKEFVESKETVEDKLRMFYRIWTLKESYLKAIGEGIRKELNLFDFSIQNDFNRKLEIIDSTELFINSTRSVECKFYEELIGDHVTTICLHKNEQPISFDIDLKTRNFKELFIDEIIKHTSPIDDQALKITELYWDLYLNKN